jgi:hypothetical protein
VTVKYEEAAAQPPTPSVAPPPHWHEWYALIEKMREERVAPVDMMGAGRTVESPHPLALQPKPCANVRTLSPPCDA